MNRRRLLEENIRKALLRLAEVEFSERMITSIEVTEMMSKIERVGAQALVRVAFGSNCLEWKTGESDFDFCEYEDLYTKTFEPVPSGYSQWMQMPVKMEWVADLDREAILQDVRHDIETDTSFEDDEILGMLEAFEDQRMRKFKLKGTLTVYADRPRYASHTVMNGPSKDQEILRKAVIAGVENLANFQVAMDVLIDERLEQRMKHIEAHGGKALARGLFKNVCMEIRTGDDGIHPCERENEIERVYEKVPPPYRLLFEVGVDAELEVDLTDDGLYPEIWGSFDVHDYEKFEKFNEQDLSRMVKKLYPKPPAIKVVGKVQLYSDLPPKPKSTHTMNGASLGSPDDYNLINHPSAWDGTLRSYKAMHALNRFHPDSAGKIARIFMEERNHNARMDDVEFPMFLEIPELEDFVIQNGDKLGYERYVNYFITHWTLTDAVHDMWKLSPDLQAAYPTTERWFNGINLGEGWQLLLEQVRTILDRNPWIGEGWGGSGEEGGGR